ncbi:MAG: CDP-diacylglycerol--serine O-phosphatidyltransferase [Gammaproteobacteria bacterium]|nr:CDP-diacylglycerol--serine O-phosphatidyltransferase [Gammaproteobacteria bacterium]MBI5618479.1 CDP-diacylglycerol--serine O-phosphatidyltransferase [Gammaproteobacteria bacterium]
MSDPNPDNLHVLPPRDERSLRRRGIYLLPNLFTTSALFAGFYAIVASINGRFEPAAVAVFVAMVLDGMDGRIARLTNTQSDFGKEYDSLADMVSFGVAPAIVAYEWVFYEIGKIGWLAAFIYVSAAALRLARFNAQAATTDKKYFKGLPSPASAAVVAGFIWFCASYELRNHALIVALTVLITVACALLMVSNIRYYSFKDLDFHGRVPFLAIFAVVIAFGLISLHPEAMLFTTFLCYASSGPLLTLYQLRRHAGRRMNAEANKDGGNHKGAA